MPKQFFTQKFPYSQEKGWGGNEERQYYFLLKGWVGCAVRPAANGGKSILFILAGERISFRNQKQGERASRKKYCSEIQKRRREGRKDKKKLPFFSSLCQSDIATGRRRRRRRPERDFSR